MVSFGSPQKVEHNLRPDIFVHLQTNGIAARPSALCIRYADAKCLHLRELNVEADLNRLIFAPPNRTGRPCGAPHGCIYVEM